MEEETTKHSTIIQTVMIKVLTVILAFVVIVYSVLSLTLCMVVVEKLFHLPISWQLLVSYSYMICCIIAHAATFCLSTSLLFEAFFESEVATKRWIIWLICVHVAASALILVLWSTSHTVLHYGVPMIFAVELLFLLLRVFIIILMLKYHKKLKEEDRDGLLLEKTICSVA